MLFNPPAISVSRRQVFVCTLLLTCLTAVAAFSFVRGKTGREMTAESATVTAVASVPVQSNSPARLEAERITVSSTGFEPAEINRPAGRFLLAVNDRSGSDDLTLILSRDTGQRLHTTRMRDNPRKHEWRKVVNLSQGRYVLSDANHPTWTCRITLTAN